MASKIATICAFLSVSLALVFAWLSPATGYELDIYSDTPFFTWVFIRASMFAGAGIILHQLVTRTYRQSRLWMLGFGLLIVSRLALLWVPYIRGYLTWDGDNITHWGMLLDVLKTGHFDVQNAYPVVHSFLAQVIQITGMPGGLATNLSTGLFSAFYIIAIYLLSTRITPHAKYQLMSVILAGFVLVLGEYSIFLMPNGWSILFLPLLFYLYFSKTRRSAFSFAFILILVLFPFFHPLSSLMAGHAFLIIFTGMILFWLYINLVRKNRGNQIRPDLDKPLTPAVLQYVILVPWVLSFNNFRPNIHNIWEQITSGSPDTVKNITDTLAKINMTGLETATLFFKLYGVTAFMVLISIVGLILLIIRIIKFKSSGYCLPLLATGSLVLCFGFLYLLYLVGFPGMSSIGGQRMLSYVAVFTPTAGGYALIRLFEDNRIKPVSIIATFAVICVVSFLSVRGLYFSPYKLQPNCQVTTQVISGTNWFIEAITPSHKTANIVSSISRYADGILGTGNTDARVDIKSISTIQIEDHFGYQEYGSIGEQYKETLLVNVTVKDRVIYDTVWKEVNRFEAQDFLTLEADSSVNKLYTNSEFATYYIIPGEGEQK